LDTEWLLSLCLTPPCYQLLKPPFTGGSFFAARLRADMNPQDNCSVPQNY